MQKRNGRSCGKVPVRLIFGTCANTYTINTIALNPTVVFALFVFGEFNEGSAKAAVMTLVVLLLFSPCFSLLYQVHFLPPRRPYAGIFFLFVFRPCNSYLYLPLFSTYVVLAPFFMLHGSSLHNTCRFLLVFFRVIFFLIFVVWFVLLCSRTRYTTI